MASPGEQSEPLPVPRPVGTRARRGRWVWIATLTLAVAGGAALLVKLRQGRDRPKVPQYESAALTRGPIQAKVTASGTLSALVTVQVGSQVSGRIQELHADFNSPVKKGQLVARIDPKLFEAAVEQAQANDLAARANLAKAQVQAEDAERNATRVRALLEQHMVAQADGDAAQTQVAVAKAQVEAARGAVELARAALNQARTNLAYTEIRSPINGVVISRNVDVGQTVAASLQSPTLFVIAEDLRKMQVDTNVAEADVGRLRPGMAAQFSVDAYPTETFTGSIRQIRNAPQTVQNVVTYDAVIDVENPELLLKPGMTANVTVVYADARDALRLPNAAIRFRPPPDLAKRTKTPEPGSRDRRTVWVLRNTEATAVLVRLGVSDGSVTEVVEGDLKEGDLVITEVVKAPRTGPGSFGRIF